MAPRFALASPMPLARAPATRQDYWQLGFWWPDKFAGWVIDQVGDRIAERIEAYLSYDDDVSRVKWFLDARLPCRYEP